MPFDSEPSPLTAHPGIVNSTCKCCVVSRCKQQRDCIIIIIVKLFYSVSLLGLGVVYL